MKRKLALAAYGIAAFTAGDFVRQLLVFRYEEKERLLAKQRDSDTWSTAFRAGWTSALSSWPDVHRAHENFLNPPPKEN